MVYIHDCKGKDKEKKQKRKTSVRDKNRNGPKNTITKHNKNDVKEKLKGRLN